MDRYDKDRIIGSGSFGNVYLIRSKLSSQAYVLKEIGLSSLRETDKQQACNEVAVLSKCKHRHIIRYIDAELDQDNNILSIIMEYADGGDLFQAIQRQNGTPFIEHRVIKWFIEISLALQYIHSKNILHRDLKSQNVFLMKSKVIKIGDFGIARALKGPAELANTAIGTPYYVSPEICSQQPYNYKSDMWALGCLLFEMAALEHAFQAQNFFELSHLIRNGIRRDLPRHSGPLIRDLVKSLLKMDPDERPSTGEILASPLLQPYLTEYMIEDNLYESTLNTTEFNKRKGLNIIKDCVKRRASISDINAKETKQRTPPRVEMPPPRPRCHTNAHRIASLKPPSKPVPLNRSEYLRRSRHANRGTKATKVPVQKDQATQYSFTMSCDDTYSFASASSSTKKSFLIKSEDTALDDGNSCCHAKENSLQTTTNSFASAFNRLFSFPKFRRNSDDSKVVASPKSPLNNNSSGFVDSYSSSKSGRDHCQHPQCHQCVVDMLWRNRIRSRARSKSVDEDEYKELEEKLMSVYKKPLFNKLYKSLNEDWANATSCEVIQNTLNRLTYEQVQSLPLMMQFVQLDLLKSSKAV